MVEKQTYNLSITAMIEPYTEKLVTVQGKMKSPTNGS